MKVINKTKKVVLTKQLKIASTWEESLFGLLNHQNPRAMLFRTRFGIHTLGLSDPIDVVILDKNYKIVNVKHSLPPYRLFFWHPKYNLCLELPSGTLQKTTTQVGDKLTITKVTSA